MILELNENEIKEIQKRFKMAQEENDKIGETKVVVDMLDDSIQIVRVK